MTTTVRWWAPSASIATRGRPSWPRSPWARTCCGKGVPRNASSKNVPRNAFPTTALPRPCARLCWRHHHALHEGGYSSALRIGVFSVWRPDGSLLQSETVVAPDGPTLAEQNRALGLSITPDSVVAQWDGWPVSYADAVEGLL